MPTGRLPKSASVERLRSQQLKPYRNRQRKVAMQIVRKRRSTTTVTLLLVSSALILQGANPKRKRKRNSQDKVVRVTQVMGIVRVGGAIIRERTNRSGGVAANRQLIHRAVPILRTSQLGPTLQQHIHTFAHEPIEIACFTRRIRWS